MSGLGMLIVRIRPFVLERALVECLSGLMRTEALGK
jgi:hypothetical protein